MGRDILSRLSEMILWLLRWYVDRVVVSWRREVKRLRGVENKWVWIGLCIFFTIFLLPYLTKEAFSDSFLLGLSFVWSAFLAVSFAYILRHPLLLAIVYVGVVFGRQVTSSIFASVKEVAIAGDIVGVIILFVFGIYLIKWANDMKTGAIFLDSATDKWNIRKTSRKRRSGYRKRR